ncbi:MAG TPA: phosphodiester glycosidase family protein [Methylomirabilota bacterium]|nr:phosphodiester glycosidase family protein [Methylomirabilota bacterium]
MAAPIVGPWEPKFKGVELSIGTNLTASGEFRNRQVVYALRVDLKDPDVKLFTTPRHTNYLANSREVGGLTVSEFVKKYQVQAAINANFFSPPTYYLPAGTAMDIKGLSMSTGVVVSAQQTSVESATIAFDSNNVPNVIFTNWPAVARDGFYNAVTGDQPLVIGGVNVATTSDVEPRTAFGISEDKRYLFLLAVDGRQSSYSAGATFRELAAWMLLLGAHDAIAMDGGGSTTLVMQNSTGTAVRVNKPSSVADSGRERTIGSHLGIYAKPVPGFVHEIVAIPEDTYATISWRTLKPASSEVLFGPTTDLGQSSGVFTNLDSFHQVTLGSLHPSTEYFYEVISRVGEETHRSPLLRFMTTNYVTTNELISLTNSWRFTAEPQESSAWTREGFDDTVWGEGNGLLWIDRRMTWPSEVEPKGTELPGDPANDGGPHVTYYFRAPLTLHLMKASSSLVFRGRFDDGAAIYLNGELIYQVRMPEEPFTSSTVATGFPCEGDATCDEEFRFALESLQSALVGENTLAVEVHNYHGQSPDVTFGLAVYRVVAAERPRLEVSYSPSGVELRWNNPGMRLQSAANLPGDWSDVAGVTGTTVTIEPTSAARFFRLRR